MVKANRVQIVEQPTDWLLRWSATEAETHATAVEALRAVQDRDKVLAAAGISVVTTIEWTCHTRVGCAVVGALGGAR